MPIDLNDLLEGAVPSGDDRHADDNIPMGALRELHDKMQRGRMLDMFAKEVSLNSISREDRAKAVHVFGGMLNDGLSNLTTKMELITQLINIRPKPSDWNEELLGEWRPLNKEMLLLSSVAMFIAIFIDDVTMGGVLADDDGSNEQEDMFTPTERIYVISKLASVMLDLKINVIDKQEIKDAEEQAD